MPTVTVDPALYEQLQHAAQDRHADPDEIAAAALRAYLWELDRLAISDESRRYREQHADIKSKYLGQYIAMHGGKVVDHDATFEALRQRIRAHYGQQPVAS